MPSAQLFEALVSYGPTSTEIAIALRHPSFSSSSKSSRRFVDATSSSSRYRCSATPVKYRLTASKANAPGASDASVPRRRKRVNIVGRTPDECINAAMVRKSSSSSSRTFPEPPSWPVLRARDGGLAAERGGRGGGGPYERVLRTDDARLSGRARSLISPAVPRKVTFDDERMEAVQLDERRSRAFGLAGVGAVMAICGITPFNRGVDGVRAGLFAEGKAMFLVLLAVSSVVRASPTSCSSTFSSCGSRLSDNLELGRKREPSDDRFVTDA